MDDFDTKVMRGDLGENYFAGNSGVIEQVPGTATVALSRDSNVRAGGSLRFAFDFSKQWNPELFVGVFMSVFGVTSTYVAFDNSGKCPDHVTDFPGYYLDTTNIFKDFLPWRGRSVESLTLDVKLNSVSPVTVKFELKDEAGNVVFMRRNIANRNWQTIRLALPRDFAHGDKIVFDWRKLSMLSLVVERYHEGDRVRNPDQGELLIDNISFNDEDGQYPNLAAAHGKAEYREAFLEHVRETSFLYFLDFVCTDPRCGGIVQDRSRFPDLMTIGGIGFQLPAYIIGSERGYISRKDAAARVRAVLRLLHDGRQSPAPVGTVGYQGFFYHFLGIDGRRKQNFDFSGTTDADESTNTVELSVIDTALAMYGILAAQMYFDRPEEADIRGMADVIYARINWNFFLYRNPDDPTDKYDNQFYLGWKPKADRQDPVERYGRFLLDDAAGLGKYTSKSVQGKELPATLDYYTDEGLLIALLAIASPEAKHRLDPSVFFSMYREGEPFIKTYPGTLFTYQFASVFLDTKSLGADKDPARKARRVNYFENTRLAIGATRDYCVANPKHRKSLNRSRFGLSACEGPFDAYFAETAPPAAWAPNGTCVDEKGKFLDRPLEQGTLTVYGAGSCIVHDSNATVEALWECERLKLLHPRFGFADAFNFEVKDALQPCFNSNTPLLLRADGPWANFTGFAIDHGPMLILIDNYLSDQMIPKLVMRHPSIRQALKRLFPDWADEGAAAATTAPLRVTPRPVHSSKQ